MKLRNKLIPIMTLATASTVVAPIASSCSFKMDNIVSDVKDITSPFTPDLAKADKMENPIGYDQAMDIYMNHVMANPEILKQDLWYFESKMLPDRIEEIEHTYIAFDGTEWYYDYDESTKYNSVTDVVATINMNNVEVNKQSAIINAKKTEFYTVSMTLGYEFAFKATSLSTEPRVQLVDKVSFQTVYKNIPIYLYNISDYEGGTWFVSIDLLSADIDDYLMEIPGGWSLSYDISEEYNYDVTTHGLTQTFGDKNSASDTIFRRSQLENIGNFAREFLNEDEGYMDFASYHMSDVPAGVDKKYEFVSAGVDQPSAELNAKKNDDNTWTFTPVTDKFHLLHIPNRYASQEYWDQLEYVRVTDYYGDSISMEAETNNYGIKTLSIPTDSLSKSSTQYYLDAPSVSILDEFNPGALPELSIKFTIPAMTYKVATNRDDVLTYRIYSPISFHVVFHIVK